MLTSSWIKLLVPVQHLQIFHRFTDFVAKSRNTLYFLQQFFAAYNNLICCKAGLVRGWPNKHYCYSTRFAAAIIRMGKGFAGSRKVTQISPFINVFFSFTQMSQNLGVLVRAAVGNRRWCKRRCSLSRYQFSSYYYLFSFCESFYMWDVWVEEKKKHL